MAEVLYYILHLLSGNPIFAANSADIYHQKFVLS